MDPEWHTYWKNPGESGLPTEIDWALPEGFTASALHMPTPEILDFAGSITYGYEGTILHLIEITPPASLSETSINLAGEVSWLECKESCIPGDAEVSLTLDVKTSPPAPNEAHSALFADARKKLPQPPGIRTSTAAVGEQPLDDRWRLLR